MRDYTGNTICETDIKFWQNFSNISLRMIGK